MNRVLVTGANGFIGQSLCEEMLRREWQVRGSVRSPCQLPVGVEFVTVNAVDGETNWNDALYCVDVVVHLASRVHVMNDTAADPLAEFRQVNVAGTEGLARMASTAGVKRFIFLSSVKVNGEGGNMPYAEHDTPAPEDSYGVSKWEAEEALKKMSQASGLEIVIIRPPLVYGPGVKANFLQMLNVVNRGIPLPFASINNRRSFIYLENLVDAIAICITHPKAAGQTYLVSDGEDVSTPELIMKVADALGKPAMLFPFPQSVMRLAGKITGKSEAVERLLGSLAVDSSKIRRELEWKQPYTMEQGLKETAGWFKNVSHAKSQNR